MNTLIPTKTIKENGVIAIKNGIKSNPINTFPLRESQLGCELNLRTRQNLEN